MNMCLHGIIATGVETLRGSANFILIKTNKRRK